MDFPFYFLPIFIDMKYCGKCKKMKDLSEFHKNKNMKDGHAHTCKECIHNYTQIKKQKHREERGENFGKRGLDGPAMTFTTKKEWCSFYELMKLKGYDPTGDLHEQFAKKYGLPYKERPPKNRVNHTPQDCGF